MAKIARASVRIMMSTRVVLPEEAAAMGVRLRTVKETSAYRSLMLHLVGVMIQGDVGNALIVAWKWCNTV